MQKHSTQQHSPHGEWDLIYYLTTGALATSINFPYDPPLLESKHYISKVRWLKQNEGKMWDGKENSELLAPYELIFSQYYIGIYKKNRKLNHTRKEIKALLNLKLSS